jgi:cold shock CspA family protein
MSLVLFATGSDMQVPLEISFRGIHKSDTLESLIREKADKLGRVCNHLMSCRVAVEKPQKHLHSGNPYRVRIDMTVSPGHELVAKHEPGKGNMHDPLDTVIRDTFNSATRQLQKIVQQQRREVKSHPTQDATAIVHKLFPDAGYGFVRTIESQEEIYFHRNSVLHGAFDQLRTGTGVHHQAEEGNEGLQATSIQIVDRQGPPVETPYRP